jgi:hypothetical protein
MKKNLRNILALSLGLMTTVAFAQDWNVDSRTRIDMSGDYDKMEAAQRATVGLTWDGDSWGIHASTVVNYTLSPIATELNPASLSVYEAYASTDLMGYASLTAGRQALEYGSGVIIGKNDWNATRNTADAFVLGLNLDMADITLGYRSIMDGEEFSTGATGYYLNAGKAEGDWSANLLYTSMTLTGGTAFGLLLDPPITGEEVESDAMTMMGLDLGYAMMGGDLNLKVMYNTASNGTTDLDMNMIGATYNVNDAMSISASQTTYGENGFNAFGGNTGNNFDLVDETTGELLAEVRSWETHGNLGHLGADQKNLSIGGTYAMGDFNLGVTLHTITSENETDNAGGDYERQAMELSLGYSLHDNAGLSLKYATDNYGGEEDTKYMWVTLNVGL